MCEMIYQIALVPLSALYVNKETMGTLRKTYIEPDGVPARMGFFKEIGTQYNTLVHCIFAD